MTRKHELARDGFEALFANLPRTGVMAMQPWRIQPKRIRDAWRAVVGVVTAEALQQIKDHIDLQLSELPSEHFNGRAGHELERLLIFVADEVER